MFFSIDKDEKKWKKRVVELSKYGLHINQYLIKEDTNSTIANYFSLNSIPKYVALNAQNEMYIKELPLPSENEKFKEIISKIIGKD